MGVLRQVVRAAGMVWWLACAGPFYLLAWWQGGRSIVRVRALWSQKLLRLAARINGCKIEVQGVIPSGGLLVANHLSYLDIAVLGALVPCAFVAKSEMRSWPVIGWLAAQAGTIFVRRDNRAGAAGQVDELQRALMDGATVVLFAEGTSSDGRQVLRFTSTLMQAAMNAGVPVTPVALSFRLAPPADATEEVCWWGDMKLLPHVLHLWTLASVDVSVAFGVTRLLGCDRKEEALRLQQEVASMVSLPAAQYGRPATCFRGAAG